MSATKSEASTGIVEMLPGVRCAARDCSRPPRGDGQMYCGGHYQRVLKHGDPLAHVPLRTMGHDPDRFWAKVDRDGPTPEHRPELGRCWIWVAASDRHGYGKFRTASELWKAHRWAWFAVRGPIPDETPNVLHACDNPACVNPSHLFLGTQADNVADMVRKARTCARLTRDRVAEIRALVAAGHTQRSVGIQFGVSETHMSRIVRGMVWQ